MTLDLTPTPDDCAAAAALLARHGPGDEVFALLNALGTSLDAAQRYDSAGDLDGVARAIRRAVALVEARRTRALDQRLVKRAAILRGIRGGLS